MPGACTGTRCPEPPRSARLSGPAPWHSNQLRAPSLTVPARGTGAGEEKGALNRMSSHWGEFKPKPTKQYTFPFDLSNEGRFDGKAGSRTGRDAARFHREGPWSRWLVRGTAKTRTRPATSKGETPTPVTTGPETCVRADSCPWEFRRPTLSPPRPAADSSAAGPESAVHFYTYNTKGACGGALESQLNSSLRCS